jgi:hypothetical protein
MSKERSAQREPLERERKREKKIKTKISGEGGY